MFLTERIQRAIDRSTELHTGQLRKGSGLPYIVHPYAVTFLLSHYSDNEDVIIAGLLHDVIEDVPIFSGDDLEREFGPEVRRLVEEVTEDETDLGENGEPLSKNEQWRRKKERYLERLKNDSQGALMIAAADKICNIRSLINDVKRIGPSVWQRFQAEPEDYLWFYSSVADIIRGRLKHPLSEELDRQIIAAKETLTP